MRTSTIFFIRSFRRHTPEICPLTKWNELCLSMGELSAAQKSDKVAEAVEINIGRIRNSVMHAKSVIHGGGQRTCVARGLHVHFGIAYQQRLPRLGAQFPQD